jgi:hypothetical protein
VVAARGQRWQCGSTMAAASLAAEAAAWQKCNLGGSSSAFGSAAAAWWRRWKEHVIGGGSVAYADNNFNRHVDNDD